MAIKALSLLNKATGEVMGLYGAHVRPLAGPILEQAITAINGFLDTVMPMEEQ